jgi:FO synthase subunit 2
MSQQGDAQAVPGPKASGTAPVLAGAGVELGGILDKALAGGKVSIEEGARLLQASGPELLPLMATADHLRREAVGDIVTYVVNRNINFTNVCTRKCGFCAFSRGHAAQEGYFLPTEEVLRRARQAADLGATEVCVQAGLAPGMDGMHYVNVCRAIKEALPEMHIHGFSPEEVLYGCELTGLSFESYLKRLKEAGVGSLPGTSAEILVDRVRDIISPGRITTKQWVELLTTAHQVGIRTTSTIMYGHIETPHDVATHLDVVRNVQAETGGITEFVPLGFIHEEAPMARRRTPPGLRKGPTGIETMKMYAVARIMLHGAIPNIQVSWVKEGLKVAQIGLMAGANDFGGTLINESISTAAGASHGQLQTPATIRALVREMGRVPAERDTIYQKIRRFEDPALDPDETLNGLQDGALGSYQQLIREDDYRFKAFFQQMQAPKAAPLAK